MPEVEDEKFCLQEEYDLLNRVLKSGAELERQTHAGGAEVATRIALGRKALGEFHDNPTGANLDGVRTGYLIPRMNWPIERALSQYLEGCPQACVRADTCHFANLIRRSLS